VQEKKRPQWSLKDGIVELKFPKSVKTVGVAGGILF
jgi:hypothetical protein